MTSGETLPRGKATSGSTTGIVLVAHGGQASSTEPTSALQPAVLRMIPVGAAIRHALRGSGAVVQRPRFRVRGWNGAQASPVGDLNQALDAIAAEFGPVPVVLVGHSMGARAAVRAAGSSRGVGRGRAGALAAPGRARRPARRTAGTARARHIRRHHQPRGNLGLRRTRPRGDRGGCGRGARRRPPDAAPRAPVARARGRIRPRRSRPAAGDRVLAAAATATAAPRTVL